MQFYQKFRAKFLIFYFYRIYKNNILINKNKINILLYRMLVKMVHEIFLKIRKYKNLAQNLYTYLDILTFYTYLSYLPYPIVICVFHFLNSLLNSKYLPFVYLPFSIYPL